MVPPARVALAVVLPIAAIALPPAGIAWLATMVFYAIVLAGGVLLLTDSQGAPQWRVFAALVTLHVAYGVGFWEGLSGLSALVPGSERQRFRHSHAEARDERGGAAERGV